MRSMMMGLVLLVGAMTVVPGYGWAAENCATKTPTTTTSSNDNVMELARASDQASSVSF
ncbi:MAG: hypothetical protein ACT4OO_01640 [Nitrospiraceae bacterium]